MKIIDCFLFDDEFNLLDLRFNELNDNVDHFILIEFKKTQNFNSHKNMYKTFLPKIIHLIVDDLTIDNEIKNTFQNLNLCYDDIIFFSNINEIINSEIIQIIKNEKINQILSLTMDKYLYNFNCLCEEKIIISKVLNYGFFINNSIKIKNIFNMECPLITNNCGWSLNFFNDIDTIINICKNKNQISDSKMLDKTIILDKIKKGKDFLNEGNKISIVNTNLDKLPKYWNLFNNLEKTNIVFNDKMYHLHNVYTKLLDIYSLNLLPSDHINFLFKLKNDFGFNPKVCYDIGSCVLHWTREAENIWSDTQVILFDAFEYAEIFYKHNKYHIGVLSDSDNKEVEFYQNDFWVGGNSYYRENTIHYSSDKYIVKKTRSLDSVIKEKNFPLPELIKIDVQGAELDILKGADYALSKCKYLIVELQDVQYNLGAPLANVTIEYLKNKGWECIAKKFSDNGPDGDYCFVNTNISNKG
jgi:FkbM family methyltransferase